jgi:uncharacterized membrane protein
MHIPDIAGDPSVGCHIALAVVEVGHRDLIIIIRLMAQGIVIGLTLPLGDKLSEYVHQSLNFKLS